MAWKDYRKLIAVGLWTLVCILFAPSVHHLVTYELPLTDTHFCYPEFNPDYYDELSYQEQYDALEQEFLARLAESDDANSQTMFLLTQTHGRLGAGEIDTLSELSQQNPENGFVLVQLISACFADSNHEACTDQNLAAKISQQTGNAAIWGELAMLRARREDVFGAFRALQQAVLAPEFDNYFSLQVAILDSAASIEDPMAKLNTVFRSFRYTDTAIGHAIEYPPSTFCANEAGTNPEIARVCLGYGEYVADQSRTTLGRMIGLAIPEVTFAAIGDQDGVAEMQSTVTAEQESRFTITRRSNSVVGLASYDASLAEYWVDSLINQGEIVARRMLDEEVARKLSDPDYQPCDPPGLRFEFPHFYFGEERIQW